MLARRAAPLVLLASALASSCSRRSGVAGEWDAVPGVALEVPLLTGWQRDASVQPPGPGAGGVALRLVRAQAVAGSPRIEVLLDERRDGGASLQEVVERNLREMNALERSGSLRLEGEEQRPITVGSRRAWRLRHEYVLGSGDVSITQVSVLLVVDGRGVAVTAAGRTELFTPLAGDVDAVLAGLRSTGASDAGASGPEPIEPIDLGKLGGKRP